MGGTHDLVLGILIFGLHVHMVKFHLKYLWSCYYKLILDFYQIFLIIIFTIHLNESEALLSILYGVEG